MNFNHTMTLKLPYLYFNEVSLKLLITNDYWSALFQFSPFRNWKLVSGNERIGSLLLIYFSLFKILWKIDLFVSFGDFESQNACFFFPGKSIDYYDLWLCFFFLLSGNWYFSIKIINYLIIVHLCLFGLFYIAQKIALKQLHKELLSRLHSRL